ncbi:MAG: DUF2177 family protein [Pirellulales bacterium]
MYLLIPGGIVLFVRPWVGPHDAYSRALAFGALFGLVTYGIYDLTNLATLEKWSVRLTVADMAWGGVLCAATSAWMRFLDGRLAS